MRAPITTTDGICFAFPDICKTPSPTGDVPVPYPNTAQLAYAKDASPDVNAGGKPVVTTDATIPQSIGDEAGVAGGVSSGTIKGECAFTRGSSSVFVNGAPVVRINDPTTQNNENATGTVLGGLPSVLVGG